MFIKRKSDGYKQKAKPSKNILKKRNKEILGGNYKLSLCGNEVIFLNSYLIFHYRSN